MKKTVIRVELDSLTEKAAKDYCELNNISLKQFLEDAIFEKLEAGEPGVEPWISEEIDDGGAVEEKNRLFDMDGDEFKKKH